MLSGTCQFYTHLVLCRLKITSHFFCEIRSKKIDDKEAMELKKISNHYLDKRKEIMENTQCKVEDVFGDRVNKDNISQDQIIKPNKFSAKMM